MPNEKLSPQLFGSQIKSKRHGESMLQVNSVRTKSGIGNQNQGWILVSVLEPYPFQQKPKLHYIAFFWNCMTFTIKLGVLIRVYNMEFNFFPKGQGLKKPARASKQDGLVLTTLRHVLHFFFLFFWLLSGLENIILKIFFQNSLLFVLEFEFRDLILIEIIPLNP